MIRIAVLTLWVKSVEGFTNVSHKFQLKVNENSTFINILSECIVIKKVFSHELTVISERLRDQKVLIKEINNSDRQFETTNLTYSSYLKPVRFMSPMFSTMSSRYKYFGLEIPEKPLTSFCDDIEIFVERKRINFLKVVSLNCKVSVRALEGQKPSVLSFLTYVLTTISTVSLIIMVIIIRCRHVNNEISFASLESLGFSMIVSNILFLTGHFISDLSSLACYVISVISHFLWLTVFSFASLRVYLIVKALNKMKAMRFKTRENQTRKRRMMTAVGVVLPLLVVGPAIVVDKLGPKYYSPGYGTGDVCFPIKFPGNLIFFSGPVFLSIILNCTIIVQIIIRIHMASVASGNMRQSSLFSEAQIYLRILSISGCFWVTGILAAYFQSEWLEYIFTIVCGLQGAFVALANLTTRRMRCCKTKERQNIQDVITI